MQVFSAERSYQAIEEKIEMIQVRRKTSKSRTWTRAKPVNKASASSVVTSISIEM